jgi:hypothetical protein
VLIALAHQSVRTHKVAPAPDIASSMRSGEG